MEQIKIIEKATKEILEQGKDFVELTEKFNELLSRINYNYNNLKENKIELLNILLKYPKKKNLFEFNLEKNGYKQKFIVGVNPNGLGLLGNYEHNLRNINDYWGRDNIKELFRNEEFKKLFLEKIGDKNKDIIEKLIVEYDKVWNKEIKLIDVGDIIITIQDNRIRFVNENTSDYRNKDLETIKDSEFAKREPNDYLNEITEIDIDFEFNKLVRFAYLLKYKDKIMEILNKEILEYEILDKEIAEKLDYVNTELKPYKALENI